jgi:hypothetical protein
MSVIVAPPFRAVFPSDNWAEARCHWYHAAMSRSVAVWMAPEQISLIRLVADAAELSVVAAGATGRGLSQSVASDLDCKPLDDLRAALASTDADLFWIASPGSFGVGTSGNDATAIAEAHARGVRIATLEPIPAAALDLAGGGWLTGAVRPVDVLRFVPRARLSESFRGASDVLEHFGQIRSMGIEMWSAASECSMGAGLYAALELILALMGEPETIDAACATPSAGQSVHASLAKHSATFTEISPPISASPTAGPRLSTSAIRPGAGTGPSPCSAPRAACASTMTGLSGSAPTVHSSTTPARRKDAQKTPRPRRLMR